MMTGGPDGRRGRHGCALASSGGRRPFWYTLFMASGNIPRLIEVLKQKAGDEKRLPCAEAFRIAHDLEVPIAQVGQACNDIGIKIKGCQLGCF